MAWAPNYASTGELGSLVRVGDALDDAQLGLALAAASRAVDDRCRRQFGRLDEPETRRYTARWSRTRAGWLAPIDDLMTTADLAVGVGVGDSGDPEVTVAAGYVLRPRNGPARGLPWTELLIPAAAAPGGAGGDGSVQVTARWGWPAVPVAIKQATLMQASRLLARRDAPFGVAGSPESGSEVRLLARLDPDVAVAVEPYRRRVWVA